MAIVCAMTVNAQKNAYKDVYFATHRTVINEYGEMLPKSPKEAYCPTRIEVDLEQQTLFIKTKTHGSTSYTFSRFEKVDKRGNIIEVGVLFFDENDECIGTIGFADTECLKFKGLLIYRKDGTRVSYLNSDVF